MHDSSCPARPQKSQWHQPSRTKGAISQLITNFETSSRDASAPKLSHYLLRVFQQHQIRYESRYEHRYGQGEVDAGNGAAVRCECAACTRVREGGGYVKERWWLNGGWRQSRSAQRKRGRRRRRRRRKGSSTDIEAGSEGSTAGGKLQGLGKGKDTDNGKDEAEAEAEAEVNEREAAGGES